MSVNEPNLVLLGLGLALVILALVALWRGRRLWQNAGMPDGSVIYSDTGAWYAQDEPLLAADLKLAGKPDYLVQQADGLIIPVEVKSKAAPSQPHEGHILQLAAYCLLVQRNYGVRPTHGILQYSDRAFSIDFTFDLEEAVLDLLMEMREGMLEPELDRSHRHAQRCRHCGFRAVCDQSLA